MMSFQKSLPTIVATLVCWLSVGLTVMMTPASSNGRDIVILFACLATLMLWVRWAFVSDSRQEPQAVSEKAKRHAGNDPDVALLLELMSEDERREIKGRLLERLQTDGETSSLEALLADPAPKTKLDDR
jgi:hypothetical protein